MKARDGSDRWPGTPVVAGSPLLPLTIDWFTVFFGTAANGSVLQQTFGMLDPGGAAAAAIELPPLRPLPPALLGLRLSLSGWVFDGAAVLAGEPTNVAHVVFAP